MCARMTAVLLIIIVGCDANSPMGSDGEASADPILVPFQGEWLFDKDRYLAEIEKQSTSDEQRQQLMEIYAAYEKSGVPLHADIRIDGNRATGFNSILQPQYDFYDLSAAGGKVSGNALWHEDRHDPGDASEVNFSLYREAEWLVLQIGYGAQEKPVNYYFRKKE